LSRERLVSLLGAAEHGRGMVDVEVIESPERDWWVVADGRVVELHLLTDHCRDPCTSALKRARELSEPYGFAVLRLGTTWRSRAFDHLEELSCRRGTCCRYRLMEDEEGDLDAE
jgi:hypothetical protein